MAVDAFFSLLEDVVDANKLDVERIWNCDETGIFTVPKSLAKVISNKGKRQVGSITSAERGQLVTAVICCSASGRYMLHAHFSPPTHEVRVDGWSTSWRLGGVPPKWVDSNRTIY